MKRITYTGPSDELLVGDLVVPRGTSADVTNDVAEQLATDPSMTLRIRDLPTKRRDEPGKQSRPASRTDTADNGEKE